MLSLCEITEGYGVTKRAILLSSIPVLDHTCTTSCCQASVSSTQFLHNQSYKKDDPLSHRHAIGSDPLRNLVIPGG